MDETQKPNESTEGQQDTQPNPDDAESSANSADMDLLLENIIAALRTVFDPEIPVNIYELGLIYDVEIQTEGAVHVRMTLTSPACPVAGSLPIEVETKVAAVPGVSSSRVEVVWDPPWNPSMMSEAAKLQTGMLF